MISTDWIDQWLRGLTRDQADRAIVAVGIEPSELGLAQADVSAGRRPRIVRWTLTEGEFRHRSEADPISVGGFVPPVDWLRLAVETAGQDADIVTRLLRARQVASAFVAVERPDGSLRPRPWMWPLRIGLVGFPEGAAAELMAKIRAEHQYLSRMLDVHRVEDEPGAVDVAVLDGPLVEAVAHLVRLRPVANAVVILDKPLEHALVLDAQLATARACTGASATAVVPPTGVEDLLLSLVNEMSHARPFDVALTAVAERDALLWAEPDAMAGAAVPEIALHGAAELDRMSSFHLVTPALARLQTELGSAAQGAFLGESHEATTIAELRGAVEPLLEDIVEERWCQAYVGDQGDNVLRRGRNAVSLFIGPREEGALAAPQRFEDAALPWENESADAFVLTVLFIPAVPDRTAQEAQLLLPRFGRSHNVTFDLDMDEHASRAAARILVLFRNRILQTAVLAGRVGQEAKLTEVVAVVPSLAGLDERRPFDAALFANHTDGQAGLTLHSNGDTRITAAGGIPAITERIAKVLAIAANDRRSIKQGLRSRAARELLIALAVEGRDLFNELDDALGGFGDASRIQLVSARSTWFLPLELAYARYAPDEDATICENYLTDPATCDGRCTRPDDTKSLCPNAFWGLSKTIERHRFDSDVDPPEGYLLVALNEPRRGRRDLVVDRALFGASSRVTAADSAATVAALGHGAVAVTDWSQWQASLKAHDTQLLVLLPHTDYSGGTLEIAKQKLHRGKIEPTYVTGNRDVSPITILFGCRTTGTAGDPAGFAARFMQKGASAVFHSTTDLRNVHATEMARRLTDYLTRPGRTPRLLSDALTAFRREAVQQGLVVAFAISAFGDADWRV